MLKDKLRKLSNFNNTWEVIDWGNIQELGEYYVNIVFDIWTKYVSCRSMRKLSMQGDN